MTSIGWLNLSLHLLAAAGVGMAIFARRGRRVDDHPLCRRCGYDLTGRPESSDRCAECGADLGAHKAIVIGHRAVRRRLMWVGVLMLLIFGGGNIALTWQLARDADLTEYKPVWWLRREAVSADGAVRKAAFAELNRRLNGGLLSTGQMSGLVEAAIGHQSNPAIDWAPWGDLMYSARMAGRVNDSNWINLLRSSIALKLRLRPQVRAGDPLPVTLGYDAPRMPRKTLSGFAITSVPRTEPQLFEIEWLIATLGGQKAQNYPSRPGDLMRLPWIPDPALTVTFEGPLTSNLPMGPSPIEARIRIHVLDFRSQHRVGWFDVGASTGVTVLPADTPPHELYYTNPGLADRMRAAITTGVTGSTGPLGSRFNFKVDLLPVALLHRGYLRLPDGREIDLGIFNYPTRYGAAQGTAIGEDLIWAQEVELVLKPDLDLLLKSSDPSAVWGEELVFQIKPGVETLPRRGRMSGGPATARARGRGG